MNELDKLKAAAIAYAQAPSGAEHHREKSERDAERMREALTTIRQWDCLNPPRSDLLADLPWLLTVVDGALSASPAPTDGTLQFLKRLANQYGEIVSSNDCSAEEIANARAEGRMFVSQDCLGYVHRPRGASALTALDVGRWLERLRAALEPFAQRAEQYDGDLGNGGYADSDWLKMEHASSDSCLKVGDLRAAKAAFDGRKP